MKSILENRPALAREVNKVAEVAISERVLFLLEMD